MPSIFVIHEARDRAFVEGRLIKPLPALGFERWQSSVDLAPGAGATSAVDAVKSSAAVLAVVSESASETFCAQVSAARQTGTPVIVVRAGDVRTGPADDVWATLPSVVAGADDSTLFRDLAAVLPATPPATDASTRRRSVPAGAAVAWDATVFSELLHEAVDRLDYARADALISSLAEHLNSRRDPYPVDPANADLKVLRNRRQFTLMSRYGEAVLGSGVTDFTVRRNYAQALIELGRFSQAVKVLNRIVKEAGATDEESFEARGLLGRAYKQQYVNAPADGRAKRWLSQAIKSYRSVYDEDASKVWHGVNAASLLLRAARDRHAPRNAPAPADLATRIIATLDQREKDLGPGEMLSAFDWATRVEAFVALGRLDDASRSLDVYLSHPAMHAFEVSSTHRQFDEVLQLDEQPEWRGLVDRLWQAVERHRAGGSALVDPQPGTRSAASETRPMLLRISDPAWQPGDVPDLSIAVRLGTVLSITGSEATIRALLKDPAVISVEDSRPGSDDRIECSRSLPFINVLNEYTGPAGPFSEKGQHALIAVIDDGIDVLHQAFQDGNGRTRIVGLWNQRSKSGPAPDGFDFGTFYSQEDIQKFVDDNRDPKASTFTLPADLSRNTDGHGTHVASIAAGRAVGEFAGGVAPEAKILFVISAAGESIGYSSAHVAALQFINQVATKQKMPVVVNLSQGMNAGAHDGRSALEVAFDEFSSGGRAPGRIVVKSAGNERGKRGHAKVEMLADTADSLVWKSWTDPAWNRDRVELWWDSINTFRFRLTAPSKQHTDWVDEKQPMLRGRLTGGGPYRIEFVRRHPDNGDSRLVIELGTGPGINLLAEGEWTLDIEAVTVRTTAEIHAWLERGGSRPSEFVSHANEEMTLSVPGTAFSVITVGAVDASKPIRVGPFSSYGPTRDRRNKPEVVAPGVQVQAARGGTFDGIRPESGTSMAAPHVTGAIALLLSRAARPDSELRLPTASQTSAALRQVASNSVGSFAVGHGYGLVDVAAFLTAF